MAAMRARVFAVVCALVLGLVARCSLLATAARYCCLLGVPRLSARRKESRLRNVAPKPPTMMLPPAQPERRL